MKITMKRALLFLAPCAMLVPIAMDIFVSGVPAMMDHLNTTEQRIQWVLVLFMLGTGIGQPLLGPICDRIGRRSTMLFSLLLFTAASLLCSVAPDLWQLSIARFFQGLGACGAMVGTFAVIRDSFETKQTYVMFCLVGGAGALMPMLAPLFGTWLMSVTESWRACFYFLTGFGAVTLALVWACQPETKPAQTAEKRTSMQNYREIFSHPSFLVFTLSGLTAMTQLYLYFSVGNFLLIRQLGVSEREYSLLFGLNALVYLVGNLLSTLLQKVSDAAGVVYVGCVLVLVGSVLMLSFEYQYGLSAVTLVVCNLVMTMGVGVMIGPSTGAAIQPFHQSAGTASGAFGAIQYGGAAIIGYLVTRLPIVSAASLAWPMFAMAVISLSGMRLSTRARLRAETLF